MTKGGLCLPSKSGDGWGRHKQDLRGFAGVPVTASDVMVYDGKTGKLIRIEDKEGKVILQLGIKSCLTNSEGKKP